MDIPKKKAILIWDGECALCRKGIEWVEKQKKTKAILPVPYQEVPSPLMTPLLTRQYQRSVQLILPAGRMLSGGGAVLGVLSILGWKKSYTIISLLPLSFIVEIVYRLISRNRWIIAKTLIER